MIRPMCQKGLPIRENDIKLSPTKESLSSLPSSEWEVIPAHGDEPFEHVIPEIENGVAAEPSSAATSTSHVATAFAHVQAHAEDFLYKAMGMAKERYLALLEQYMERERKSLGSWRSDSELKPESDSDSEAPNVPQLSTYFERGFNKLYPNLETSGEEHKARIVYERIFLSAWHRWEKYMWELGLNVNTSTDRSVFGMFHNVLLHEKKKTDAREAEVEENLRKAKRARRDADERESREKKANELSQRRQNVTRRQMALVGMKIIMRVENSDREADKLKQMAANVCRDIVEQKEYETWEQESYATEMIVKKAFETMQSMETYLFRSHDGQQIERSNAQQEDAKQNMENAYTAEEDVGGL